MPRFHYRALRQAGGEIEGELVAEDERAVAAHLQTAGSFPIEIAPTAGFTSVILRRFRRARLGQRERVLFTRQLAALLGAGVTLDRALHLVAAGREHSRRAALAEALLAAVNRGESLSRAVVELDVLAPPYAMVIAAGEARGDLAGALERLASIFERNRAIAQSLANALIYPASVVVVACVSVAFLLGFVVPRFSGLLTSARREPPFLMKVLLGISGAVQDYGLPLLLVAAALAAIFLLQRRKIAYRIAIDRRLLRLPVVGALLIKIETERLAFLLGTMVAAGVAVPAAVGAAREATTNEALRAALAEAGRAIDSGTGVAAALTATGLVPELALELVRIGEETGDLPAMLLRTSEILRREIEATASEWIAIVAPLSMILLGLLIGAIAFAIFGTVLEVYDIAS
jgi:general secretion pathway protein F